MLTIIDYSLHPPRLDELLRDHRVFVSCDGSFKDGSGGYGVVVHRHKKVLREESGMVPAELSSAPDSCKLYAIFKACEIAPMDSDATVVNDSAQVIAGLYCVANGQPHSVLAVPLVASVAFKILSLLKEKRLTLSQVTKIGRAHQLSVAGRRTQLRGIQ